MALYTWSMHRRSQIRNWPQLEEGILDLILQRLPHPDCLNFGRVCRGWRSVFRNRRTLSRPPPCILLGSNPGGSTLRRGIIYEGRLPGLLSTMPNLWDFHRIVGSCFGWLVIACLVTSDIYLLHPASNQRISLPSLATYFIRHVDLTSNPGNSHYVVVARTLYGQGHQHSLAWWSPGDQEWTIVNIQQLLTQCVDSVFHEGKLYVLGNNGHMVVCTINPQTKITTQVWINNFWSINHLPFKRLVPSNEELFLVVRQTVASQMYVFRYVEGPVHRWVRVHSLGDRVLLIGIHGSESVCTKDLMGSTYESNSIYCVAFNQPLHKYSMTDRRTEDIVVDEPSKEWVVTPNW